MSTLMDEEIKRWNARRKTALVLEIIQGKAAIAEASRAYDLPPSELESWVEDGNKGMDGRDDLQLPAAAVRAGVHVDVENPLEQPGPADAVRRRLECLGSPTSVHALA